MTTPTLTEIPIDSIIMDDRHREDYGDLDELKRSLEREGQIQTIAVEMMDTIGSGIGNYKLIAGGRRLTAMKELGWEKVMVRIYTDLTPKQRRSIELHENLQRKDFTWQEEKNIILEIHEMMMEDRGNKHWRTKPDGWSAQETADMIGVSRSTVSRALKLASAMEVVPQLEKAKDAHEAENLLARLEEGILVKELARRAESVKQALPDKTQAIIDAYQLGDFFELIGDVEDESVDFIDLDPDYNIEFGGSINKDMSTILQAMKMDDYTEFEGGDYSQYLMCILEECHRVMKPNSWILMWYAQHPWANEVYMAIETIGFETNRIPLVWNKAGDNEGRASSAPDIYLGRQHETAYYARKGKPVINRRARGDVFTYPAPHHSKRIHPCEKPLELCSDILTTFLTPMSHILVPFAGSGNTLLAAFDNNMTAVGFDLGEKFRDGYVGRVLGRDG
jgi:ParB/RepB/Spo0J family partition protein